MGDNENENSEENSAEKPAEEPVERVYQMLWDCEYCGTKGLLGKDHRFCPACGSKQNPDNRYFPEEDSKVEVINDNYIGADKKCPACSGVASAASTHCPSCGSPLEGASEVSRKGDLNMNETKSEEIKPKGKSKTGVIAGVVILVAAGVFATFALIKKDINVIVTSHLWKTSIEIETLKEVEEEGECSSVPTGAINVVDYGEKKVDCRKEKADRGDGTFTEKEVCDTIHRCAYTIEKWKVGRPKILTGGLNETAVYPVVYVTGGSCIGCTREGKRSKVYKVFLKSVENEEEDFICGFNNPESWKKLVDGQTYKAKVNMMGSLSCDDI